MISFKESQIFIYNFELISKSNNYLVQYGISKKKPKNFKTAEILKFSEMCLQAINTPNQPIKERIEVLEKLDQCLQDYASRVKKSIEKRWWFPLLKCFGYEPSLNSIDKIKQSVFTYLNQLRIIFEANKKIEPLNWNEIQEVIKYNVFKFLIFNELLTFKRCSKNSNQIVNNYIKVKKTHIKKILDPKLEPIKHLFKK